jgi:ubiquinone/menaquinone biosynthesis C-methylase UbiE
MPDVFANIAGASEAALETIANVLELRAAIPQQRQMLHTYLQDIEFPDRSRVLEVGCGTGAIARVVAAWPRVAEVVGVDPSPALLQRARLLGAGVASLVSRKRG